MNVLRDINTERESQITNICILFLELLSLLGNSGKQQGPVVILPRSWRAAATSLSPSLSKVQVRMNFTNFCYSEN